MYRLPLPFYANCEIALGGGVEINNTTVNDTLQSHPDWSGLLCISDSLKKWDIPNAAGKIEQDQIDQLPLPFMAHTRNREFPLAIVTQVSEKDITLYSDNYNKPITKSRDDFNKLFTGAYLIAEPNEQSGEKNYTVQKRKALFKTLIPLALVIIVVGLSSFFLYRKVETGIGSSVAGGIYLQYIILLAGSIVTSLLLWYEIDKNNPLLHKVCTGIAKGNCSAILTGKKSKVFSWLSWSEVGFFYFFGGLLALLFSRNINSAISLVTLLNLVALPYIIFSVYYQWRVARQWCLLCLGVQALLLLGGINVLANHLVILSAISVPFLITAAFVYLIPVLLWYTLKPSILRLQEGKNTKREYLRIKFNSEVFETQLKKQKAITVPVEGLGIDLGNPYAENSLIKVCNPYCGPCANAHPKIESLLEEKC